MSKKYNEAMETAIINAIVNNKAVFDFESQKIALENLAKTKLFVDSGISARELGSKLLNMSKQKGSKTPYFKKVYKTKTQNDSIKKDELIESLADLLGVESDIISSLENANKSVLLLLIAKLTPEAEAEAE